MENRIKPEGLKNILLSNSVPENIEKFKTVDVSNADLILLQNDISTATIQFDEVGAFLKIQADIFGDISKENVLELIGIAFDDCSKRKKQERK